MEIAVSCVHRMALLIPNSCLRIIRTKRCIAAFTCFPPLLWQRTPVLRHQRQPGLRHFTSGRLSRRSSGIRSVPGFAKVRVSPSWVDWQACLLAERLRERDGKRGEPEGEPSLNETGIQVFFFCCCCFVSTLDPSFCGLFTSSVLLFPLVENGICDALRPRVFFCKRFTAADHETSFVLD